MFSHIRNRLHRPSPGTVIGSLALVVALSGVAFAAIPSSDGTFRGCYAKTGGLILGIPHHKGDLRLVDEGEACRSYESLVTWNQQGTPGTPGVSGYQIVQETNAGPFSGIGQNANCPAGKKVLGGGFTASPAAERVVVNRPELDGNSWRAEVQFAFVPEGGNALTVRAVCANVQ
jgi:hypothetical protein